MTYYDDNGRICDPVTVCWGLGIHYHCTICWEPGGMTGHYIPDSEFGKPRYTCQETVDESVL